MADSDQAIRDIVAQLQGSPTDADVAASLPAAAPVGVMPGPEVTPAMSVMLPSSPPVAAPAASLPTIPVGDYQMPQVGDPSQYQPAAAPTVTPSTVPGPGGYSAADRFNKFSLPPGSDGPLSVADAQKVIDSYESTGGHAFAPAAAPARVAPTRPSGDDWAPPAISMVPPPIAQVPAGPVMGRLAAIQRPTVAVPAMASVLGAR